MTKLSTKATQSCAAVLVALLCHIDAVQSGDTYVEIVPTRAVLSSAPSKTVPPTWPKFPVEHGLPEAVFSTSAGAVITTNTGALLSAHTATHLSFQRVQLSGPGAASCSVSVVAVNAAGDIVALVSQVGVHWTACSAGNAECTVSAPVRFTNTSMKVYARDAVLTRSTNTLWIATTLGLLTIKVNGQQMTQRLVGAVTSLAHNTKSTMLTAGSAAKIYNINIESYEIDRWDWVTQVELGMGGVIDDAITSLAVGSESLFIGNAVCLNTRNSYGVYGRIGPDQGLPVGNITSLAVASTSNGSSPDPIEQIWIGAELGVQVWTPALKRKDGVWKFLAGPRWLTGGKVKSIATLKHKPTSQSLDNHNLCGDTVVVLTAEGVTFLEQQCWTLLQKASWYEDILTKRHDRHGLTSETNLAAYGQLTNNSNHDNDNNGLWTSLVVVAEYMRYSVTKDPEALKTASKFFNGMVQLNEVTNKPGLMARSCCNKSEANKPGCGVGTWIHDKEVWHNSTAPGYEGWTWKGDTSSDESTGHIFALIVVATISPIESERATAKKLLDEIVGNIVKNDYNLIDVTGKPTTWGRWSPADVNHYRPFSDERGVQSLQMLAYIAAAANATASDGKIDKLWIDAYHQLTNSSNQYNRNLLNLKIQAPCDDNYSDDELTFLPYFTFLFSCTSERANSCPFDREPVVNGLTVLFDILRPERSSLWNAIVLATIGDSSAIEDKPEVVESIRWNLQTWPLELVNWPINNSARWDIVYDHAVNRFGANHAQSTKNRSPLPANERTQGRWNSNAWDVTGGGDGLQEMDPGAWLLPYWMARYYNIIEL